MSVGQKLPSERQICNIYNVSRTTVRNVILELEHLGLLTRIQGKGTFVAAPENTQQDLAKYYSFTETTKKLGRVPTTSILSFEVIDSDRNYSEIFHKNDKFKIIHFSRLRKADDTPMLLEYTTIEQEPFSEITAKLLNTMPLYDVFEKKYDRRIAKVKEIFSATILTSEISNLLEVEENSAGLKIIRFSYDESGKIIEYTESFAASDKFKYESVYYPK